MKKTNLIYAIMLYSIVILLFANGVATMLLSSIDSVKINTFYIGIGEITLSLIALIVAILYRINKRKRNYALLCSVNEKLKAESIFTDNLIMPIMMCKDGKIVWYNNAFRTAVLLGEDVIGDSLVSIIPQGISELTASETKVSVNNKNYQVFITSQNDSSMFYFIDTTELDDANFELYITKPVVGYITIDNLDELSRGLKDSERAEISSVIQHTVEIWSNEFNCIIKKLSSDRFFMLTDRRGLEHLRANKFDILKRVKSISLRENAVATLSIGLGYDADSFEKDEAYARDALDMALGRGGDQVAVKNSNDFEFYGGTSATTSKRSRVRTRVVADALVKLINESGNVLIMGHKNADFDCIGSAYGLSRIAASCGKKVNIIVNRTTCLCNNLVDYISKEAKDIFVSPDDADEIVNENTLLIITDTHRKNFVESADIYKKCQNIVIIDHHRKTVDYIDNSVIFYHEPYSSSASEMVTELVQNIISKVNKVVAEGLLAGITLDTKNFVLHTSSRTFEASAYLRSCGADPVVVKNMFQNSVEVFKQRAELVKKAFIYKGCAISYSDKTGTDTIVACAQAADEMLGINGVSASFVLYGISGGINISARSLGAVNVQLIMESLGGGGHLTMAAAQVKDVTPEQGLELIKKAIDNYISENS